MSAHQDNDTGCLTGQCGPPIVKDTPTQERAPFDPLDSTTFTHPEIDKLSPQVIIEFCDRCRWLHRATWIQTELLLTFPPPAIQSITLIPLNTQETGARFRVWLLAENSMQLVWDRKMAGGFPELKELKQRIRDVILPGKSLGHSDTHKAELS
ncbi:hypothetical protein DACRYDRAFT_84316 [Dacryopinax primogenitus]|uniref:Rdx family-domain-containing protein n=1 Tax=Dacryopinax primogenitus (strain DJM 731) TaxID=1858805 RepID=M5FNV0_DACPD|nr:uncharacterized protein DACRYDRAFT_84316 [Dacryopinax primogenitus]EJT97955.1 hypothetical protein DACRYDRAFT_84316 [Dacryopinax primogenitus]